MIYDIDSVFAGVSDAAAKIELLERELFRLREALAYEARVVEAQTLDVKALSKGRREQIVDSVERMRKLALEHGPAVVYAGSYATHKELQRLRRAQEVQEKPVS